KCHRFCAAKCHVCKFVSRPISQRPSNILGDISCRVVYIACAPKASARLNARDNSTKETRHTPGASIVVRIVLCYSDRTEDPRRRTSADEVIANRLNERDC